MDGYQPPAATRSPHPKETVMNLGGPELLILVAVVLLLFGSSRVPQLARSLGRAKHEFESATKEGAAAEADRAPADEVVAEAA